jgi:hypothetical protein
VTALTQIEGTGSSAQLLETIAITNQTANSAAVTKAIRVPAWANYATIVIDNLTLAGTSPLFDFIVGAVNITITPTPDDGDLIQLGGWDGITQKTAATSSNTTIDIGPNITFDDTGSATASDRYGIAAVLPQWLYYTYTTDGTTDDEDYSATISIFWRK